MPSSKAVNNIEIDKPTSFASTIAKKGNSASLYRLGERGGKGLKKEERVITGSDGPDATSMVREVGINRSQERVAFEVHAELSGEGRRLLGRQAVFLDEREV